MLQTMEWRPGGTETSSLPNGRFLGLNLFLHFLTNFIKAQAPRAQGYERVLLLRARQWGLMGCREGGRKEGEQGVTTRRKKKEKAGPERKQNRSCRY